MASKIQNSIKQEVLQSSSKFLHPKSRKCVALVKKVKKDTKKEKAKQETKLKQSLVADKLLWFQKHIDFNICPYTIELTAELVERYIMRNDEELEQIKLKQSIGKSRTHQHIGREDAIQMTKEREKGDYESCGLEIPNILNVAQFNVLKNWKGDLKTLPNFKLYRFSKKQLYEEVSKKERLMKKDNISQENEENKDFADNIECVSNISNNADNKTDSEDKSVILTLDKVSNAQMDVD